MASGQFVGWNGDTGLYRNAAGVVEVNNGTAGTFRDLKGRYLFTDSQVVNSSTSTVSAGYASDTYLAGSSCVISTAGNFKAKGQYRCTFDMVKTAAGTATPIISVRIGTAGTTADTARLTFTLSAGTAAADTGTFEIIVNWQTVGSGTSAIVAGLCRLIRHTATAAGLISDARAIDIRTVTSSGFDSSTATTIGVSFNGGASFSGTNTVVQAVLEQ